MHRLRFHSKKLLLSLAALLVAASAPGQPAANGTVVPTPAPTSATLATNTTAAQLTPAQLAQNPPPPHGIWTLTDENDWFFGTDRDLTNILRLAYTTPNYQTWNQVPLVANEVGLLFDKASFISDADAVVAAAFYAQQNMYTPANLNLNPPNPYDRPYAGWIGVAFDLIRQTANRRAIYEANGGWLGPQSGAEALQKSFHSFTGGQDPQGWDQQLKNEPVFQFTYRQDLRMISSFKSPTHDALGYDVIGHGVITVGNGWDYLAVGAMARVGYRLPMDYGPARPRLGEVETMPYGTGGTINSAVDWSRKSLVVYFCLGAEGRAVARDISLNGNTFAKSASVTNEPFVGEFYSGVIVEYGALRASFLGLMETDTFRGQQQHDQWRGIISVGAGF